jgi:eukaryotic translation initiation factor 2C
MYRLPTFFQGLQVKTTHLGRHKTIQGITDYTAKTYIFNHAEFGDVSVEEYILKSMFLCTVI